MKQPDDDEIHYHGGRKTKEDVWFMLTILCGVVSIPVFYIVLSVLRLARLI